MILDDKYYVTFTPDNDINGDKSITVLVSASSPNWTGGFGGWDIVERPKRKSVTRWKGQDPRTLDLPILFDGLVNDEDQEDDIAKLIDMSQPDSAFNTPPPTVAIQGLTMGNSYSWVIQDISWDTEGVIWDHRDGEGAVRLRQGATVSLLEFVDDQVILTQPTPVIWKKKAPTKPITTKQHDTLGSLAVTYLKNYKRWVDIWELNKANANAAAFASGKVFKKDPRAELAAGMFLLMPSPSGITVVTQ